MKLYHFKNPQFLINELHDQCQQLLSEHTKVKEASPAARDEWTPAIDIREDEGQYTLFVDVPGVMANNIEIHFEDGALSIKGVREPISNDEQANFRRIEKRRGSFCRQFDLPDDVDAEKIQAHNHNGVLEISIPKLAKEVRKKKIEVQVGNAM